ncbi:MAG: competence/damage-inducible protein A [Myxococcota bacterium]
MNKTKTVAVVVIGAEVLSGKVEDANGPHLIRELRRLGAKLGELRVIDDGIEIISNTVSELAQRFDYVITTGGIGPTHDDLTLAGVARSFGVAVVRDPELVATIEDYYGERLVESHLRLAEVPDGAVLHRGDAPVPTIQMRNVFILPGVPQLMRSCFGQISSSLQGPDFVTRILYLSVGEAEIAQALLETENAEPSVAIGSYPRYDGGPARVKVTVESVDPAAVGRSVARLRQLLPESAILDDREESVL